MSDQEIISQLRTGQRHKALVQLYAHLPKVERMVRIHGDTRADAKDLLQDTSIGPCATRLLMQCMNQ